MIQIELERVHGDFGFEAKDAAGHKVRIDSSPETGGDHFGVRPMQMLLMGLGGCSGIDILSILKKQRQQVDGFRMHIEGERQKDTEPSLWASVKLTFEIRGRVDPEKARRACALSMEKYCSVAATLRAAHCHISWELNVIE
jgi:putative redox protein